MVYSHDTARIVQWMLKLGTPEIRSQVIDELLKHVPKMLLSKYACLCVKNMFKKGSAEQRNIMINSLKGKTFKLTLHSVRLKIIFIILFLFNIYVKLKNIFTACFKSYGFDLYHLCYSRTTKYYDARIIWCI